MKNYKNRLLEKIASTLAPSSAIKTAKTVTDVPVKALQPMQNYATKETASIITKGY